MTKKQWIIFFAGAEAFHTLSHIMLYFSDILPFSFYSILVTKQLNFWAVIINGIITILLLNWAKRLR